MKEEIKGRTMISKKQNVKNEADKVDYRLLSLYGPWPYGSGPMALALRPYGSIFLFQEL